MARFPVTVAEYVCFVRGGGPIPDKMLSIPNTKWTQQLQHPDHPVIGVSMGEAKAYAAWLTQLTGQPWRLPTEIEWEKAARWDPQRRHSRIYPWGDSFSLNYCNCANPNVPWDPAIYHTEPIGSFPTDISPYGVQDMAGGGRDITFFLYWDEIHRDGSLDESFFPIECSPRGGSFSLPPERARAAFRRTDDLSNTCDVGIFDTGFRLVRTPREPFAECRILPYP